MLLTTLLLHNEILKGSWRKGNFQKLSSDDVLCRLTGVYHLGNKPSKDNATRFINTIPRETGCCMSLSWESIILNILI